MLLVWAVIFVRRAQAAHESMVWLGLAVGVAAGLLKGWLVMQRAARRNLQRIDTQPEPRGILRAFHPALLLIIPVMMGLGITMRHLAEAGTLHWGLVAAIYVAIFVALNVGAVPYWTYRP
jgi:H+/Cl- antiporter ClcA